MKRMKKALALLLTLAVTMAMAVVPAMAASLSVAADSDRTYNVYQVFTGTVGENNTLTGLVWGQNGTGTQGKTVSEETLTALEGTSEADLATVITQYVDTTTPIGTVSAGASITVDPGYYYLTSESDTQVVVVTGDETITPKSDLPTMVKKVQEDDKYNQDDGYGQGYNDVADYDIGDAVPFKLIASIPAGLRAAMGNNNVYYTFHDNLSDGLTLNRDSIRVTVDGQDFTANTMILQAGEEGFGNFLGRDENGTTVNVHENFACDFEVVVMLGDPTGMEEVVVEYTATLSGNADIGLDGNPNAAYLIYHTPTCDSWGATEEDSVIVFTYELDTTKVDGTTQEALQGAQFRLYKTVGDTNQYAQVTENGVLTGWTTEAEQATTLTSDANGLFRIAGLDDGTYYLEETAAPEGYNQLTAPIEVVITATTANGQNWTGGAALTDLSVTADNVAGTANTDTGIANITVANNTGSTLPETGGMGTTIFYIVGALLVIGAGVVIITRKRMHNNER